MSSHVINLDDVIASASELAPLPTTATQLLTLTAHEDWGLKEVVDIVRLDAPLTGRVLRVANSAASAARVEITDIDRAVSRLGASVVVSLSFSDALRSEIGSQLGAYGVTEEEFWRDSVAAMSAADRLQKATKAMLPHAALAGLLHDVGKLVLGRFLTDEIAQSVQAGLEVEGGRLLQVERDILGTDFVEVGALVARHWKLPDDIAEALQYRYAPEQSHPGSLLWIVAGAERIASEVVLGEALAECHPVGRLLEALGLDQETWDAIVQGVAADLDELISAYA